VTKTNMKNKATRKTKKKSGTLQPDGSAEIENSNLTIAIRGASQNNLVDLDLDIPINRLTVITGPSGAGKSSLALETLYAEGQRLYAETFSTYARQFLERLPRPNVRRVDRIPPAISVTHEGRIRTGRVTVLDLIEGSFSLQMLFAREGIRKCDRCGAQVLPQGGRRTTEQLLRDADGERVLVTFDVPVRDEESLAMVLDGLTAAGYSRGIVGTLQTEDGAGPERPVDETDRQPGETDRQSGETDRQSGETDRQSGETRRKTRKKRLPGRKNGKPGTTNAKAGTTNSKASRTNESGDGRTAALKRQVRHLDDPGASSAWLAIGRVEVIQDRVLVNEKNRDRLGEAIEGAWLAGNQRAWAITESGRRLPLRRARHCPVCGTEYPQPTPYTFSAESPLGACPECGGYGYILEMDRSKVVPDPTKSLAEGAIRPFQARITRRWQRRMEAACLKREIDQDRPFRDLDAQEQEFVLSGGPRWEGVSGLMEYIESFRHDVKARIFLSRYRRRAPCPQCSGVRLGPEPRAYELWRRSFAQWTAMTVSELKLTLDEQRHGAASAAQASTNGRKKKGASDGREPDEAIAALLDDLTGRLETLEKLGLGHLQVDRRGRTLSGGELSRVHLARGLGTRMAGALYILDEPTVGLHSHDVPALCDVLERLCAEGNTVVVTEHHPEVLRRAHHVVELGPGGGGMGGRILYQGPPLGLITNAESVTGPFVAQWLARKNRLSNTGQAIDEIRSSDGRFRTQTETVAESSASKMGRTTSQATLTVQGARKHNLANLTVHFPLGRLVAVTGVSGSGKSTLIRDVLYDNLAHDATRDASHDGTRDAMHDAMDDASHERMNQGTSVPERSIDRILGADQVTGVLFVDQDPPSRSSRSNPATFLGILDPIRRVMARQPEAKRLGLSPSWFSFNSPLGGCKHCHGSGVEVVEMQFLPDVAVPCPDCGGTRYAPVVLEVPYKGLNMAQILDLTVDQAAQTFSEHRAVCRKLSILQEVGLGYLALGQRLTTLSAGEAQRIKLARALKDLAPGSLVLLDEPSVGLHPMDVSRIVGLLRRLVGQGVSVILVDHDMELVSHCDHVIDLGPGGGTEGGRLVDQGSPQELAARGQTATGMALIDWMGAPQTATNGNDETPALAWQSRERVTIAQAAETAAAYRAVAVASGLEGNNPVIELRGAMEHNLDNLNLDIPRGAIVAITGISGSGKSTLAFDILFAEGQRRYLETQAAYVRHVIRPLPRPHVERLSGLPPTIAVSRKLAAGGPRSTVATVTEVAHYLRLLVARFGVQYCPRCNLPVQEATTSQVHLKVLEQSRSKSILLAAPVLRARKGHHRPLIFRLRRAGIKTIRADGVFHDLAKPPDLSRYREHDLDAVCGAVTPETDGESLMSLVEQALDLGSGTVLILNRERTNDDLVLSSHRTCPRCHRGFEAPDPLLLSFNSPRGACATCDGLGTIAGHELGSQPTVCPDCGGSRLRPEARAMFIEGISLPEMLAWNAAEAAERFRRLLREGVFENEPIPTRAIEILEEVSSRLEAMNRLGLGYLTLDRRTPTLSTGEAQRLRLAAQLGSALRGAAYILDEPTVGLHPRDTKRLIDAFSSLKDRGCSVLVVEHDDQVIRAADHVLDLGPGAGTKGGRLVVQGTVADLLASEASVTGRELRRLAANSPIPAERDGRRVSAQTDRSRRPQQSHKPSAESDGRPLAKRGDQRARIRILGARLHNLANLDAEFLMGAINCVTGVSGSGKSSLVLGVLGPALGAKLRGDPVPEHLARGIAIDETIRAVRVVDQAPIGRTSRSIPATYVGFFDEIRQLMAARPEARIRGFKPSRFSFNVSGGRCETCKGRGRIKVEMKLLPDVLVPCEACGETRYEQDTLSVRYRGKNMADILDATVDEALELFSAIPKIRRPLQLLANLDLGYLKLGQPSPTLSGGEAQRIRLATELYRPGSNVIYLLDEPTTGLHMADVRQLIATLHRLVDAGNTVVVIEHNLDLIVAADHVLDLGPEAGADGGRLVASGAPHEIAQSGTTTGRFLAQRIPFASPS